MATPGFPPIDLPPPPPTSIGISDAAFPPYPPLPPGVSGSVRTAMCLLKFQIPRLKFKFGFMLPPFPPKLPIPRIPFGVNCLTLPLPPGAGPLLTLLSQLGGASAPNPFDPVANTPFGANRPLLVQPDPDTEPGA